ncbi:MAG: universal stress protein [Actinobacteria bacterium]|nr:universal stress protein [Actinomycetota bacterium]
MLVAVDDSHASRRVVSFVNAFFAGLDVEVIGICVGAEPAAWIPGGLTAGASFYWPYMGELPVPTSEDRADAIRAAERLVEASGLRDDEVIAELGDPVLQLCNAAVEHTADLIVVGDNHKRGWRRLLEGSVTTDLQHQAPCPVLIVP